MPTYWEQLIKSKTLLKLLIWKALNKITKRQEWMSLRRLIKWNRILTPLRSRKSLVLILIFLSQMKSTCGEPLKTSIWKAKVTSLAQEIRLAHNNNTIHNSPKLILPWPWKCHLDNKPKCRIQSMDKFTSTQRSEPVLAIKQETRCATWRYLVLDRRILSGIKPF